MIFEIQMTLLRHHTCFTFQKKQKNGPQQLAEISISRNQGQWNQGQWNFDFWVWFWIRMLRIEAIALFFYCNFESYGFS